MNFIRNLFETRFFFTKNDSMFKYNFPTHIFGTISVIAFGFSFNFIKNYYFSFIETTNKIENVVEKNIPYEEKYNRNFDNINSDESNISSVILNQKIASLKEEYKRDICTFQTEYSEIETFYYNNNDESDDDDIYNDEEAILIRNKIYILKLLLQNEDQIKINAFNQCLTDVKSKLMDSLQNNFILENTPIGNIIMVYNSKKEGFSYYSDKSISNKYLESVCKKYCIQFKCKILFNTVFINEGKLSYFKFLKNEVKNKNKKNAKLSFRSFKEQFSLL